MKKKYRFTNFLQFFAEESGEPSVVAEGQEPLDEGNAPPPSPDGTESVPSPPEDVMKQESFAKRLQEQTEKRLSEERAKWEQEQAEKYKDYDTYKKATDFLMKSNGINDPMTLKEQLEMTELQERAEKNNLDPETQKRLEYLEERDRKAQEYEREQAEQKQLSEFENSLKDFCKEKEIDGKAVDHMELWSYMHENGISKPEAAYKAMKADVLEQKLATAKEDAVKEYLASKKAPKAEGSGATAFQQADTSKMSWEEIDRVAAARIKAANQAE